MSLPSYPSIKPTQIKWLGHVPSSWPIVRLKRVADLNPSKQEVSHLPPETQLSFFPMELIGEDGSLDYSQTRPLGEVQVGYTYFTNHDVVFAKVTPCFENGKGALISGLEGGFGFGTTELTVLRAKTPIVSDFIWWLSKSDMFRLPCTGEMQGAGGLKRVPDSFVGNFQIALPSIPEQQSIARFLDRETAAIDELVEAQRELIALIKEKRQAVISHAVTKGLDPTAPMKPSGIDWLGDIPAHWERTKVKFTVTHISDCLHTTPTYDGELIYPAIRTADITRGRLDLTGARLVAEDIYQERTVRLTPKANDIVYSRKGERFGMAALIPEAVSVCLGQRTMLFRAHEMVDPGFLMWSLNGDAMFNQVLEKMSGATSPHVNISDLRGFHMCLPPLHEQVEIAKEVERDISALDKLVDESETAIALLQERRAALISAAVTGKIDVRGLVDLPERQEVPA